MRRVGEREVDAAVLLHDGAVLQQAGVERRRRGGQRQFQGARRHRDLQRQTGMLRARLHYVTKPCDDSLITFINGLGKDPSRQNQQGGSKEGVGWGDVLWEDFCLEGS